MPAARLWRVTGVSVAAGASLSLSALHLYGSGGRLDAAATLTSSHAPLSGTLAALQDTDAATLCSFSDAQFSAAGFFLLWDFGGGGTADVWGLRVGGGAAQAAFLNTCFLQYHNGATWVSAELGAFPWPGSSGLTAAPIGPAIFNAEIGIVNESTAAGSRDWAAVYVSADGQKIVAVAENDYLYTSADGGANFTARTSAGSRLWTSVAMSADGQKVVAAATSEYLYASVDGGANFTAITSPGGKNWVSVAVSADGQKIVAAAYGDYLYTSADGGANFTARTSTGNWISVAASGDGQKIVVVAFDDYLYTSADGGANFTSRTSRGSWISVAASGDGQRIVAVTHRAYLYTLVQRNPQFLEPPLRARRAVSSPLFSRPVGPLMAIAADRQTLVRDIEHGGPGTIYGTTKIKGTPNQPTHARVVLLHQRSKLPVRETWSDPVTGNFAFTGIDTTQQFLTLAEDAAGNFRPVAANLLTPEVLP